MNIFVVEDALVERLAPASTSRPAWAITCGSYRLLDWLMLLDGKLAVHVRPFLNEVVANDYDTLRFEIDTTQDWTLIVNARLAPTFSSFEALNQLIKNSVSKGHGFAVGASAAMFKTSALCQLVDQSGMEIGRFVTEHVFGENGSALSTHCADLEFSMLDYPHDIIDVHMKCCVENIEFRLTQQQYQPYADGVFVAKKSPAAIPDSAVFDVTEGPVVIDSGCTIGPFTYFRGPVYVGPNSKISEHSSIKDAVSIGHTCKIGGEVEGVVVEPYSNKQHYGFLGHSHLGSWINLGAGTCNSDLKNTYGTVNMQLLTKGQQKVATGMQFVGCVIGDYAKTAINTSVFTGKLIGVGSMVYGMTTTNVPSFVNYARSIGQMGLLPPEVIVTTQQRMFGRRKVIQRPCDIQLVRDMYTRTTDQRPEELTADQLKF